MHARHEVRRVAEGCGLVRKRHGRCSLSVSYNGSFRWRIIVRVVLQDRR